MTVSREWISLLVAKLPQAESTPRIKPAPTKTAMAVVNAYDEARSSDGFLSVFLIRGNGYGPLHPIMMAATDGFKDHRQDDHNTIEIASQLFERVSRIKCGD